MLAVHQWSALLTTNPSNLQSMLNSRVFGVKAHVHQGCLASGDPCDYAISIILDLKRDLQQCTKEAFTITAYK